MAIALVDIVKEYPGTRALKGVSVEFRPGEVHAVVGENGAGKTTLVSILSGANRPTRGHIAIDGVTKSFDGARAALDAGIAYVSQEGTLVPFLTGAENIMLGSEPGRLGVLDRRRIGREAAEAARHFFPTGRSTSTGRWKTSTMPTARSWRSSGRCARRQRC